MPTFLRMFVFWLCALAATAVVAAYPDRPVHLIVPFAAGGPSDAAARVLAQSIAKTLAQPVVVENKPGANGALAVQSLLNAAPDGYTLLWGTASMVAIPLLQKAPTESLADLAPVSSVGQFLFCLFLNPQVPAATLSEFIAYAKAHPGEINYASSTNSEYMAASQLSKATGMRMVRVPYKGGAQAMPDLLAGRVQVNFGPLAAGIGQTKEGRLRVLGCLAPSRSAALPDVPTFAESGLAGVAVPTWQSVFAPPKTPADIVGRLSAAIGRATLDAELRSQYERQNFLASASTPEQLRQMIAADLRTWTQFIQDNEIEKE